LHATFLVVKFISKNINVMLLRFYHKRNMLIEKNKRWEPHIKYCSMLNIELKKYEITYTKGTMVPTMKTPLKPDRQHVICVASSDWLQCPSEVRGESRLFTFHLDSWQWSFYASFFFFLSSGGNQSKKIPTSYHVPQRAPNNNTSLLSHIERQEPGR
jgi:hypothetical protein